MNSVKKQRKMLIGIQIFIFIFIVWLYIIFNTDMIKFIPGCMFYKKLGLLCPACGGTRFMISLLNFDLIKAFYIHSVFFLLVMYLTILDISYVINVVFNKKIYLFRWWHIVFWGVLLLIFTIFRNINIIP